ncbi:ATP-binding cassette domain-containing protein, partial [Streptomyces sp. AD55]|uniref:ABC transporter ATP-binding protein n=1 Tax=Streptomyces sp. AD55 TaxID=3242895 RepID=UPI003527380F
MIQVFGLTSNPRKELPPAVDDVSFEARAGRVTALLGASGAGKTTVLRLMLELQPGRGVTHFRGRPLHRIAHPVREVGVLLGDVPGHPGRTVRGHVRMLCAAAGVPTRRGDEALEAAGLDGLRDQRLGTLSRGMDRRLGLACALLGDPHTLVLDDPVGALSAREARWLHEALRAHADDGGAVLFATADPKEAARAADRVVTLDRGRLAADQEVAEFSRTRLRPRVVVRTPHAARLAALLTKEARAARRSVEVVRESGNRLAVYGSTCADIGESAYRHGVLVHQLADETGDMGPGAGGATGPAAPPGPRQPATVGLAVPATASAHLAPGPTVSSTTTASAASASSTPRASEASQAPQGTQGTRSPAAQTPEPAHPKPAHPTPGTPTSGTPTPETRAPAPAPAPPARTPAPPPAGPAPPGP